MGQRNCVRRCAVPRGHAARREAKTPKKKNAKRPVVPSTVFATEDVQVIKKRRKPKEDDV